MTLVRTSSFGALWGTFGAPQIVSCSVDAFKIIIKKGEVRCGSKKVDMIYKTFCVTSVGSSVAVSFAFGYFKLFFDLIH